MWTVFFNTASASLTTAVPIEYPTLPVNDRPKSVRGNQVDVSLVFDPGQDVDQIVIRLHWISFFVGADPVPCRFTRFHLSQVHDTRILKNDPPEWLLLDLVQG